MRAHRHRLKRYGARRQSGASIILVSLFAVLLIIGLVLGFKYCMYLGGSSEVRNAVDAAALNVSKRVCQLKVPPQGVYGDCVDTTGTIGLANINRVWGKAYLINANAQSMQMTGAAKPDALSNADQAYHQAQNINDSLGAQLKDKAILDQYFNAVANNRQASMIGQNASVSTDRNSVWATAMVDRGGASNLKYDPVQIPTGLQVNGAGKFLRGYMPLQANNKNFCLVTFKPNEMPHLISDTYFDKNRGDTNPVPNAINPLPNAFRESGHIDANEASLSAAASAVANPLKQYSLSLPHSYVTIQFGNFARWFVEGKQISQTTYGAAPETQWGVKKFQLPPPNNGKLDGYASLGNEYKRGSVWAVITALPGDHRPFLAPILQRLQEIYPAYTMQQLIQLLSTATVQPGQTNYFIYPVYGSADLTDPQFRIAAANGQLPPWLNPLAPDGIDLSIGKEQAVQDDPNYNWENITGGSSPTGKHWVSIWGQISWQPGTGYTGCLGVLKMARYSDCYFTGTP